MGVSRDRSPRRVGVEFSAMHQHRCFVIAVSVWAAAFSPPAWGDEPPYLAVFADGQRVRGEKLRQWKDDLVEKAKLDDHRLLDPGRPLRWLRNRRLSLPPQPAKLPGYVEFVGGDRLPGRVVRYEGGDSAGGAMWGRPHLQIEAEAGLTSPDLAASRPLRIDVESLRRVVWAPRSIVSGTSARVEFLDGRQVGFRSLRWSEAGVRVLTDDGPQSLRMNELAAVHLPAVDFWETYWRQLALLSPNGERIVRVETDDGLVVTASLARLRAKHHGGQDYLIVQPTWCWDALWVQLDRVRTLALFAPHEVPLTCVPPVSVAQRSLLGAGWQWQVGRSVQGTPLRSGGIEHGWGLGVHAFSQLTYPLPELASTFCVRIGLDQSAGEGGCVKAHILREGSGATTLFESRHLVGSSQGVDTGELTLAASDDPARLSLMVHPAHAGRPDGADPLDIRDALDWLEPLLTLQPEPMIEQVAQRRHEWVPAWEGWRVSGSGADEFRLVNHWEEDGQDMPRFAVGVAVPRDKQLALWRTVAVGSQDRWLMLLVRRLGDQASERLDVRLDGQPPHTLKIPQGSSAAAEPLLVPVAEFQGKQIEVGLEYDAGDRSGPVHWEAIALVEDVPLVASLFDERPDRLNPKPDGGLVAVVDRDAYSGRRALQLRGTGDQPQPTRAGGRPLAIREHPAIGQYRYLRMAVRMSGPARLSLDLRQQADAERPLRYDVGMGPPALPGARRILGSVPSEWIVMTRDLYGDFGAFTLNGVEVGAAGDGTALVDHLYLARRKEDFHLIGAQSKLLASAGAGIGALTEYEQAIAAGRAALVELDVEGRRGSGVVISEEGTIVTTAYVAVGLGRQVQVRFSDGTTTQAITLGMDREHDLALVRILDEGTWPHLPLGNSDDRPNGGRWAALALLERDGNQPLRPGAATVRHHTAEGNLWVSLAFRRRFSGGPLINRKGELVGLHSRPFGTGGTMAAPINLFKNMRDKLTKSEVHGSWPAVLTPQVGLNVATRDGRLEVIAVRSGGPAERAGIRVGDVLQSVSGKQVKRLEDLFDVLGRHLPDDEIDVALGREGKSMMVKVKLDRRG